MGCSKCKEKRNFKQELYHSTRFVENYAIWFVVIWSIFAVYGIYSFIKLLL